MGLHLDDFVAAVCSEMGTSNTEPVDSEQLEAIAAAVVKACGVVTASHLAFTILAEVNAQPEARALEPLDTPLPVAPARARRINLR